MDLRRGAVAAITPVSAGLPGARCAITIQRDWSEKKDPLQTQKSHTRHFLSSLPVQEKSRATRAVRGHWSVENRNHHKRDASAWQEDRHRHRKPNAALNLALTRNVLLALIPPAVSESVTSRDGNNTLRGGGRGNGVGSP